MIYVAYVDMSAKSEQKNDSAIAISNGESHVYVVTANVKQQIREWLTELSGVKSIEYRIFALFIYLAARDHLGNISQLVIDRDYTGADAESTIKNFLLVLLRLDKPTVSAGFIRFENVKGSNADRIARQAYIGKGKINREVKFTEIELIVRRQRRSRGSPQGT